MNGAYDAWDLAGVLVRSGTFWKQTMPLFATALALAAVGFGFVYLRVRAHGRRRLRALVRNESGAAEAMDFVLTFPIVMFVSFLFVQLLLGAHASLVVHYAAYSAARAARAAYFDLTLSKVRELHLQSLLMGDPHYQINSGEGRIALRQADSAARVALMSAVPSSVRPRGSVQGVGRIILRSAGQYEFNRTALQKKAAYAFTRGNARVDVGIVQRYEQLSLLAGISGTRIDAMPVWARVQFRYPLTMPAMGRIFGKGGVYVMDAEVTIL